MNTYTETGESHYTGGAWSAFVVGAAIGAAAALILAPARGRDTRAYLKQRGNELGRDAMQRGRETWREQSERVKSAISTGWERANDAMHQANTIKDGRIAENNFNAFKLSRIDEDPPEINIRFFKTGHWLLGMGHDRATSVQSAIGDAIFQITGKRFRDLPYGSHDLTWG